MQSWFDEMRRRSAQAIQSGAVVPIRTEQIEIDDGGLSFAVRALSSLEAKDDDEKPAAMPGGPRDPDFNPFLKPEAELDLGLVNETHRAVLNKYPVCECHLVLARKEFAEQRTPLEAMDFAVLADFLKSAGGLGFYNGGAEAGASQRHKHVQWIPADAGNAHLGFWQHGLPADAAEHAVAQHSALNLRHIFVRYQSGNGVSVEQMAASQLAAYTLGCSQLGLQPDAEGNMPAYNMLVGDGWLLLVPRMREHFAEISINAVSFGGVLYVRTPEQMQAIRRAGPLQALQQVSQPVV